MESVVDGRYQLVERLGEGAFGEVWRAQDAQTPVVIKLLKPRFAKEEHHRERFRREVSALQKVVHRNVIEILADGECPQRQQPYYVMAHCDGAPLSDLVGSGQRLPEERTLALMDQVLEALGYAHSKGIIHRDMKPDNILVESSDNVRILDFGLAKHLSGGKRTIADLTQRSVMGSAPYMSPEQCQGIKIDPKTDIYSVGCILMEMLTGTPPFTAKSAVVMMSQHVMMQPPRMVERLPDVNPRLAKLVARCLEKDPSDRPDAQELRAALKAAHSGPSFEADGPTGVVEVPPNLPKTQFVKPPGPVEVYEGGWFGAYKLIKELGRGGFGAVFRTEKDNRPVALKVFLRNEDWEVMQAEQRMEREIKLLKNLEHPRIPKIYDSGVLGEYPYAVMDLIEGQDLEQYSRQRGRLTVDQLSPIMMDVLDALDHAHLRGVVHCDIKPSNIRISHNNEAYLLDLGISKIMEGSNLGGRSFVSSAGMTLGTVEYMPPEFARGRELVSPAADVYSLGVLMYQMFTGSLPFPGDQPLQILRMHVEQQAPPLAARAPEVPREIVSVVERCMEKDPHDRYPTAGVLQQEYRSALDQIQARKGPQAPPPPEPQRLVPRTRPNPTLPGARIPATTNTPVWAEPSKPAAPAPTPTIVPDYQELGLAILSGLRAGEMESFKPGWTHCLLGRDPQANIRFPVEEDGISGMHLVLRCEGESLFIDDLPSSSGTWVEGVQVPPGGFPLAKGATVRLGARRPVLLRVDLKRKLTRGMAGGPLGLQRVDSEERVSLASRVVLGRSAQGGFDPAGDVQVSSQHCRVTPSFGSLVLEDLNSANGTWLNGERVSVAVLKEGDKVALGDPQGATFRVGPYVSSRVLPQLPKGQAECARGRFEVSVGDQTGHLFMFAGNTLKFGRNSTDDPAKRNDLILRAYPKDREDPTRVAKRTMRISGQHGELRITGETVAVVDNKSTYGTKLDGRDLNPHTPVELPDRFMLEVGGSMVLRGRVFRREGPRNELQAVRLERTRDGEHITYFLLVRETTIGSGDEDPIFLPLPDVRSGHATIGLRDGNFVVTRTNPEANLALSGHPLEPRETAHLEPGQNIFLGTARLSFSWVNDDDMKPPTI